MSDDQRDGFERLYRENVDAVFAYAASRSTREGAEDAVEETFLIAWRRFDELPVEPRARLIGVARRVLSHQWRARDRREALGLRIMAERASEQLGADPAFVVAERDAALAALDRLSNSDRELLVLSVWSGLSPVEVAQVLGCSKSALLVRLHRARRRFESALEDDDVPDLAENKTSVLNHLTPTQPLLSKETI